MGRSDSRSFRLVRASIPWAVLVAMLALTMWSWTALDQGVASQARTLFERGSDAALEALRARITDYEQGLRDAAAHAAVSPPARPAQWRAFVDELHLPERYPALSSLEFVPAAQALLASSAPEPALLAAIASREPVIGVRSAQGEAADAAGFDMYVPVFAPAAAEAPARERALAGFVVGTVRIYDLIHGVLDGPAMRVVDTRIFDAAGVAPERVLVDTRTDGAASPLFERVLPLPMPGRTWTVQFVSRPEFDAALGRERPVGLFAAGVVASFLAFVLASRVLTHLERAQRLSMHDPLTGLYNRRYLEGTMDRELARARRARRPIGVVMLDIDHFKRLNDTRGHDAGDFVLARIAELLRHSSRGEDIACRFGGEEFALILPGASLAVARDRAEAIRAAFAAGRFELHGEVLGPLTLSAGVAALAPDDADWGRALHSADRALYTAKQAGRNRVLAVAPE